MSEQEKSNDDNRCCDNGFFGVEHDCQKQPPQPQPVEEFAPPRPRLKLRQTDPKIEEVRTRAGDPVVRTPTNATELTFLLDLLLNEKLSKSVKEKITERIRIVEAKIQYPQPIPQLQGHVTVTPQFHPQVPQAPGTSAGIHSHLPPPPPGPGPVVNNTGAIAQALASRENAIARSFNHSDKPDPGRTGPRKF